MIHDDPWCFVCIRVSINVSHLNQLECYPQPKSDCVSLSRLSYDASMQFRSVQRGQPRAESKLLMTSIIKQCVICSYSSHGSHGNSQYFDPDLPSGNLLHSYWKLQFSSLIYPWIAWWFSSSLCKRLPEGMSSTAHGRMDLLRHWSTMNSSSQLVTNESPQSHCRCEWQNEHAHLREIAMVHHWITIPRS